MSSRDPPYSLELVVDSAKAEPTANVGAPISESSYVSSLLISHLHLAALREANLEAALREANLQLSLYRRHMSEVSHCPVAPASPPSAPPSAPLACPCISAYPSGTRFNGTSLAVRILTESVSCCSGR